MRVLAEFTMESRLRAVIAVGALGALGILFPPINIFSGGLIALIALRLGMAQAAFVAAFGALLLSVIALLLVRVPPVVAILSGLVQWLPLVVLGEILRRTISWPATLSLVALVTGSVILLVRILVQDVDALWVQFGMDILIPIIQGGPTEEMVRALESIAPFMTGLLAGLFMLSMVLSLILGRYWQALLYNPGAFGTEFQSLQLGSRLGIATVVLAIGGHLLASPIALELAFLLGVLFFFQGIAIMHALTRMQGLSTFWLVGLYVLLVIALPQMFLMLATWGAIDSVVNFRERFAPRKPPADD